MKELKSTLHIDLGIVKENYENLLGRCLGAEFGVAVKADCYGLGAKHIAPIFKHAACKHFFVADIDEGIEMRKIVGYDVNIYVLHGAAKDECETFLEFNLIPVLNHISQIEVWNDYAYSLNRHLPALLHIDTGMHRLGLPPYELEHLGPENMHKIDFLYVMSHLSCSEDINSPNNQQQLELFKKYADKFPGIKRSLASSSGIFLGPEYHFDLVRAGAGLYGINIAPHLKNNGIKNPVTLTAPIIQLHNLPAGESVGYDGTYINEGDGSCPIATIPIGYADGFARALGNKGVVYIDGHKAPIIGRVSMDLTVIDVSGVPPEKLHLGTPTEVLGRHCTPDDLAKIYDTNTHEILTTLGRRYERIYT